MKTDAKAEIVLITPAIAHEWLEDRWPEQRPIRKSHVMRLASDMESGRFKLSPDAIVRVKGKLANGQHRLEAVLQSGTSQHFLVLNSNDDELYKVIDAGLRRTAADGLIDLEYNKSLPSIARWVMAYYSQDEISAARTPADVNSNSQKYITQSMLIDYCRQHRDCLIEAAVFVKSLYAQTKLMPVSVAGAVYVLASQHKKTDQAKVFLSNVYIGGGSDSSEDLRNRLISNRGAKTKFTSGFIFGLTMKSFKAFCDGRRPGVLRWAKEEGMAVI